MSEPGFAANNKNIRNLFCLTAARYVCWGGGQAAQATVCSLALALTLSMAAPQQLGQGLHVGNVLQPHDPTSRADDFNRPT